MQSGALTTDADRLVDQYRRIGEAEKHVYGQNGGTAPNYNINLNAQPPPPAAPPPAPKNP